jgi:hypothetical protein
MNRTLIFLLLLPLMACSSVQPVPQNFLKKHAPEFQFASWDRAFMPGIWTTGFRVPSNIENELADRSQIWLLTEGLKREKTPTGWRYSGEIGFIDWTNVYVEKVYIFATLAPSEKGQRAAKILGLKEIQLQRVQGSFDSTKCPYTIQWEDEKGHEKQIHALYAFAVSKRGRAAISTFNVDSDGRAFAGPPPQRR